MEAHINRWDGVGPYWLYSILILEFVFLCIKLSGVISLVTWAIFVLSALIYAMKTVQVLNRLTTPWKGLFYPIMIVYTRAAGAVSATHGQPVDRNLASVIVAKSVYPQLSDKEAQGFVEDAFNSMVEFTDKKDIKAEMIKSKLFDKDKLDDFLNDIHKQLRQRAIDNESSIPQWTAAKIIEQEKGKNEKIRLLVALLTSRVS